MNYIIVALVSATSGFLLGWFLKRYNRTQRSVVSGTGNYVIQSGGSTPSKQDKCKYCGG
jgi:hypothetical protein